MAENPSCPDCEKTMVLRSARRGRNAGGQFWGCSDYPRCKGTRDFEGSATPHGQSLDSPPTTELKTAVTSSAAADLFVPFDIRVMPHHPTSGIEIYDSVGVLFDKAERTLKQVPAYNWAWEFNDQASSPMPGDISAICENAGAIIPH